ncbi:MAG: heme-binding protein [Terricaulis sp.]
MLRTILLVCAFMIATPAAAQPETAPPRGYGPPIAVSDALALIDKGMEQSAAQGLTMAFAVVEPSGELVAFARMDDVPYASIQLAQQKARTAARLRLATTTFDERVQGGRLALLSSDEVLAIGGGVPIVVNGRVIGALGVSGGSAAQDAAIAEAIVAAR